MDLGIKGKVAIVTGAGSQIGFGKAIAMTLAKEGCDVVATDVDLEGARQTATDIKALGRKSLALKVDVTKMQDAVDMVEATLKEFGKVDILINNAGACTPPKPFMKFEESEWNRDIAVNLNGTINCTRSVLPFMIEKKSGSIVSITSGAGIQGGMFTAGYSAGKAGIIAFSKCLSRELGSNNVRFNLVSPGIANTGFAKQAPPGLLENAVKSIPLGKLTTAQDIANAVVSWPLKPPAYTASAPAPRTYR
jgi:NAD(P)-dependent dehydrogenase (short-subunit alcohol dehydrogenase family)